MRLSAISDGFSERPTPPRMNIAATTGPNARLVNLMPHNLVVMNGASFVLAPSGHIARMEQQVIDNMLLRILGATLPLATVQYGAVSALPPPQPGVLLVVFRTVAAEVTRTDLVFPDLEIRDENHQIIGCQQLTRFAMGGNSKAKK